jgi:hypothetical protein
MDARTHCCSSPHCCIDRWNSGGEVLRKPGHERPVRAPRSSPPLSTPRLNFNLGRRPAVCMQCDVALLGRLEELVFFTLLQLACTTCNEEVQTGIFDERFPLVLVGMGAPFVVATALVWWLQRRM